MYKRQGQRIAPPPGPARYQDVFGETLLELARQDRRVVGVTPAMPTGCSMNILLREMPDRCFDVGIAEGHAVTFSAGLAAAGMVPFCNIYSTFMQRAYDNVIHDVAIQEDVYKRQVYSLDRDTPCPTLEKVSREELQRIAARVEALGIPCSVA